LFNDLKIGTSKQIGPFKVAKWKGGIIIDAFHPAFRSIEKDGIKLSGEESHKYYFELIRDCIRVIA